MSIKTQPLSPRVKNDNLKNDTNLKESVLDLMKIKEIRAEVKNTSMSRCYMLQGNMSSSNKT